ncbi:pullulanase [Alkalibaculum bacchi]|uniref:Pullulanase n=1 Tax=Alkalibaculum bacchi TaxID=645887 RepID=A0A366IFS6_9FIRM|nr:type I pullulanase [Alkalibaculum bacchi]RBP70211.1 pullulanase [Alkalibaculum bacchi]
MPNDQYPVSHKQLGSIYSKNKTIFRLWAPTQEKILLAIYENSLCIHRMLYNMKKDIDGVFEITIEKDLEGKFYTFIVNDSEVTDPYSVAVSENGVRSAVVDLKKTDPGGWKIHSIPRGSLPCDTIIYELNLIDYTGKKNSDKKGAYLSLVDSEDKGKGYQEGLSHLKDLGVTHVHILPVNDFLTVEECKETKRENNYNWGYDPEHYNVPEGSYSSVPSDPKNRIFELKKMIMKLHQAGIKVILDVVYNHTYRSKDSNFNVLVPDYYYRMKEDGSFSNGSGVGNELATERSMVRKFILESVVYWVKEYKVDGFRFDLMGLIDKETVNEIVIALKRIDKEILIYGEPWIGFDSILPIKERTLKGSQAHQGFSVYNDAFRDGIKGGNDDESKGFIQGNCHMKNIVETGIAGTIDYDILHRGFAKDPEESINYINSHDNLILYDKIKKTCPYSSEEELIKLNKFALSILFTSQGIPFIHEGNEILRTKQMVANSYDSPLAINKINWDYKERYYDFYTFVRDLIYLRKAYRCFRLNTAEEIRQRLKFVSTRECTIAYTIKEDHDDFDYLLIIHNAMETHVGIPFTSVFSKEEVALESMKVKKIFDERGIAYTTYDITKSKSFTGAPQSTVIYQIVLR